MEDHDITYGNETRRKARTKHTCCECRSAIKPGDVYIYGTGLMDGAWYHYKLCTSCDDWAQATGIAVQGWPLGTLCEAIAERYDMTRRDPATRYGSRESVYFVETPHE